MNKLSGFCSRIKTFYRVGSTTPALAEVEVWQPSTNEWNTGCHLSLHPPLLITACGHKASFVIYQEVLSFPLLKKRTLYTPPASLSVAVLSIFFPILNMKVKAFFPRTYCYFIILFPVSVHQFKYSVHETQLVNFCVFDVSLVNIC